MTSNDLSSDFDGSEISASDDDPSQSKTSYAMKYVTYLGELREPSIYPSQLKKSYNLKNVTYYGELRKPRISRGLGGKLCACASANSARNSQNAQLTHSATIENRVSDFHTQAHF